LCGWDAYASEEGHSNFNALNSYTHQFLHEYGAAIDYRDYGCSKECTGINPDVFDSGANVTEHSGLRKYYTRVANADNSRRKVDSNQASASAPPATSFCTPINAPSQYQDLLSPLPQPSSLYLPAATEDIIDGRAFRSYSASFPYVYPPVYSTAFARTPSNVAVRKAPMFPFLSSFKPGKTAASVVTTFYRSVRWALAGHLFFYQAASVATPIDVTDIVVEYITFLAYEAGVSNFSVV
jgi:hypothetical protein